MWYGHKAVEFGEPITNDEIVYDTQARVYDIALAWNTEPDPITGELLAARFFWRIPKGELAGPRYIISVERPTPEAVIFTLRQSGNEKIVGRSPVCRLEKVFRCKLEDIGKHLNLVKIEDLEPSTKNSPNPEGRVPR